MTACNRRRTSDVFTPRAPSSTAAGSGGRKVRIWASTCWPRSGASDGWASTRPQALSCRRRHAEAILLCDVSDPRLLRYGAHRQFGGVEPGLQTQGDQGFVIERLKGRVSLQQAPSTASIAGSSTGRARCDRRQFGDRLGDEPSHRPADRWPRIRRSDYAEASS